MTKILITSALPYVAGVKHIGNLAGSLLPADLFARYNRLCGRDVLFVCGTDEHGTPAELAAARAGQPVADYCAAQHRRQAAIYRCFGLSFDHFGRTSSAANHALTQALYHRLDANGLIAERNTTQFWSAADGRFLPDRYVVGTCPHCGGTDARGDQCDGCGRLLDSSDLIRPASAISGSTDLERRESRHLFLRQSALADRLRRWIDGRRDWDPLVTSIARKWLDQGLEDRCITRDLAWGVPVPRPGFEGKVFYVWFDAPIGYLAAVREWAVANGQDWRDWTRPGPDVRWTQFLAKDNVPFHTIVFPATLLGAAADIRLVDRIKGFDWLTWSGGKFSTSAGRGVFTDAALDLFPADCWRWWLTANAPEGGDVDFRFDRFVQDINADLADTIGNLVNRLLRFATSRFGDRIPRDGGPGPAETALAQQAAVLVAATAEHLEAIRLRKALRSIRALWALANAYLAHQAPWTVYRTDPASAACILRTTIALVHVAAVVSAPAIPFTANRILAALGAGTADRWPTDPTAQLLAPGDAGPLSVPEPLFPRVPPERLAALQAQYGCA